MVTQRIVARARLPHRADRRREHHASRSRSRCWFADRLLPIEVKGVGRLHPRALLLAVRLQPAAVAANFLFNLRRVHLQAAVALAAAVRKHVRRRDHLPAAVAVGGGRAWSGAIVGVFLGLGWAIFHILIVAAAGLHLHDAHHRLHRRWRTNATDASIILLSTRKENTNGQASTAGHDPGLHRDRHRPHDRPRRRSAPASASASCAAASSRAPRASRS